MDYIIKRCEYEELLEVAHLYNELSKELQRFTQEEKAEDSGVADNTMARVLRSAIKECNLKIFVAKNDDKVIGFISGSIKKGEALVSGGNPIGYVEGAYVCGDHDKEDVLVQLEDKLLQEFKTCKATYRGWNLSDQAQNVQDSWMSSCYQHYRSNSKSHILQ